jgi:CRP-like cAMP-binding protein
MCSWRSGSRREPVRSALRALDVLPRANARPAVPTRVLRLVKGGLEREALASGQVDAVIDPANGAVFLLHEARWASVAVGNRLLAALPPDEYRRLLAGLQPVELACGDVLHEPGQLIRHVYFPVNGLVSLLTTVEGHRALEVGLVGREGVVGISVALGVDVSSVRAVVQGGGTALRMTAARFRRELCSSLTLQDEVYRFADATLSQANRNAACHRFHVVEARLARRLLMTGDALRCEDFPMTQAFLADMLGVRRVGVTAAACALQQRKLIGYHRGSIRILDRKGLEAAACGCYRARASQER